MRLFIQRAAQFGYSMTGELYIAAVDAEPAFNALSLERCWNGNKPGKSCVPAGFYYLEPHNGTKYKETFALIGAQVSHAKEPGVPRFACVVHQAPTGLSLEGCTSFGLHLSVQTATPSPLVTMTDYVVKTVLAKLRARPAGEKHYLTIFDPPDFRSLGYGAA